MTSEPASSHDTADWFEQKGFRLRFGWGPNGLRRLAPAAAVVVVVDVLSFSTSVDVALSRGAVVLPYRWHDGTEQDYAEANRALVAVKRPQPGQLSLRPSSLTAVASGLRLVLPSPNGSALAFAAADAGAGQVMVGSLRNATAVGRTAATLANEVTDEDGAGFVAVVAAGERWRGSTGPLRPAIEDLLGAGAILAAIEAAGVGPASPEARVAIGGFVEAKGDLRQRLIDCGSGRELTARGFADDVDLAAAYDVSTVTPTLRDRELIDGSLPTRDPAAIV